MIQKEKIEQAKKIVQEENVDLWLTVGRETGMNSEPVLPLISTLEFGGLTCVFVTKDEVVCLAGHLDSYGMSQMGIYDEVITYDKSFKEKFFECLNKYQPKTIAMNYSMDVAADGLTHGLWLEFQEYFKEANYDGEILSSSSIVNKLRGRKTPSEVAAIKEAIQVTEKILVEAKDFIEEGKSQIDIHRFCQERIAFYQGDNAWEIKHNPGVMLPNVPGGHAGPGEYQVKKGNLVTLDFGVKMHDYCSDIQRVYYVLKDDEKEAPKKYQDALRNIQHAQDEGVKMMRPNTPAYVPDERAREVIKEFGYPDFNFGFGHQVGRETHDGGVMMGPRWERYLGRVEANLEVNNVFTVDINILFEDGNIGQEDMAIILEDETVYLTTRQPGIYLCGGKVNECI
ncbi:M24 family metallopeptidase [Anaerorhabdus sp.]|uniref:M24 family metallopeptidase n=1 Tax=Anaerorhabdus sp. TaxID=1872524 RepID=UPI002FC830A6